MLSSALNAARDRAIERGATLDQEAWAGRCVAVSPVNYGETLSLSFPLISLKGRATRKHLQISIYRLESGKYELTTYFL